MHSSDPCSSHGRFPWLFYRRNNDATGRILNLDAMWLRDSDRSTLYRVVDINDTTRYFAVKNRSESFLYYFFFSFIKNEIFFKFRHYRVRMYTSRGPSSRVCEYQTVCGRDSWSLRSINREIMSQCIVSYHGFGNHRTYRERTSITKRSSSV